MTSDGCLAHYSMLQAVRHCPGQSRQLHHMHGAASGRVHPAEGALLLVMAQQRLVLLHLMQAWPRANAVKASFVGAYMAASYEGGAHDSEAHCCRAPRNRATTLPPVSGQQPPWPWQLNQQDCTSLTALDLSYVPNLAKGAVAVVGPVALLALAEAKRAPIAQAPALAGAGCRAVRVGGIAGEAASAGECAHVSGCTEGALVVPKVSILPRASAGLAVVLEAVAVAGEPAARHCGTGR